MVDWQLEQQWQQTIYVAQRTGRGASGQPSYGAPASRLVRVEQMVRRVPSAPGEAEATTHVIFTDEAIGSDDRVWLPGIDQTNAALARTPKMVESIPGEDGTIDHYEVYL